MEQALFADVRRDFPTLLEYCRLAATGHAGPDHKPRFSRMYCGAEFCVHRLPAPSMTATLAAMCADSGLEFTLVLPPAFDTSLRVVDRLVALMTPGTEVVINDWAELRPVLDAGCTPVMGRAMNRLFRDPRIDPAPRTPAQLEFLRTSQAHVPMVQDFLKRRGLARVELDNVRQGLAPMPEGSLPCSIYTPWTLISVSRWCGENYAATCPGKPCFSTKTFVEGIPIIEDGTCTFWFNAGMPDDPARIGIDRVVSVTGPEGPGWLMDEVRADMRDGGIQRAPAVRPDDLAVGQTERLVLQALDREFKSVCQIACGRGAVLEILERMNKEIVAWDESGDRLRVARRRAPDATLFEGDGPAPGGGPLFDLVIDLSFLAGIAGSRRDSVARGIVDSLSENGLYLTIVEPGLEDGPAKMFEGSGTVVWSRGFADESRPGPYSMVLIGRNGSNQDIGRLIDAFLDKRLDGGNFDFVDLTHPEVPPTDARRDDTASFRLQGDAAEVLRKLGFRYLWREVEGEGRTMFHLTHADFSVLIEFSPTEQNRPHYRTIGSHNVAYRGDAPDMKPIDVLIDVLTAVL